MIFLHFSFFTFFHFFPFFHFLSFSFIFFLFEKSLSFFCNLNFVTIFLNISFQNIFSARLGVYAFGASFPFFSSLFFLFLFLLVLTVVDEMCPFFQCGTATNVRFLTACAESLHAGVHCSLNSSKNGRRSPRSVEPRDWPPQRRNDP